MEYPNNSENQYQSGNHSPQKKSYSTKTIILIIALIVAVVLAVVLLAATLKTPANENQTAGVEQDAPTALSTDVMKPVESGQFEYRFEDIRWEFESVDDTRTRVKMMFENFSRRDNVYVTFGNPYKLGTYTGECEETDRMEIDPNREAGIALAFVECWDNDTGMQMAVFQEGKDVVIKNRDVTQGELLSVDSPEALPAFEEVYTITLTEVVR